ncbi:MAG: hypothetical protein JSV39_02175 [Candidatus Aenigmatarchaeota archaeon]|nr:MAG: hypothetical protein JSV39_02175 [Candidatus Aenigmarchaeota archaeon]
MVIAIILILNLIAIYLSNTTGRIVSGELLPFTVSEVFDKVLLGEDVFVTGEVIKVLDDHVSKKGYEYQQFFISDGSENIKVFCSVKYGRTDISEGDEILFDGEFKKYYGTHEIYGFCSEIKIL